jgi:glucosamine--fructose-6-phosphate aminotransferase (isomerizing)
LAGTYLFSKIAGLHVNTAAASEFNYLEDFLTKQSLIIALSQSGETIDVIEPLNRAQKKGAKIAAVVNSLGSTIYRMGNSKILLGAGPEIAVASTKAYVAKIAFLVLVAYSLVGKIDQAKDLLSEAAKEVERLLEEKSMRKIEEVAKILAKSEHIYTIGRGVSYPTALESALKIKEVSYIHTEGLAGGELKHGTIALVSSGTPCLVYAPNDETYDAIISNATEIKSRGGLIIGIGPKHSDVFDHWIEVKSVGDASLIPMVVPAQLFAYYLALEKGYDPDKPRNLAKSVTVK